jgi:hypothetical protein
MGYLHFHTLNRGLENPFIHPRHLPTKDIDLARSAGPFAILREIAVRFALCRAEKTTVRRHKRPFTYIGNNSLAPEADGASRKRLFAPSDRRQRELLTNRQYFARLSTEGSVTP